MRDSRRGSDCGIACGAGCCATGSGCGAGCCAADSGCTGEGCWANAIGAKGSVISMRNDTATARILIPVFIKGTLLPLVLREILSAPKGPRPKHIPPRLMITKGPTARKLDKRYNPRHILNREAVTHEARTLLHQWPRTPPGR